MGAGAGSRARAPRERIPGDHIEARFAALDAAMQKVYDLRDLLQSLSEDERALSNAERVAESFGSLNVDLGSLSSGVLAFVAVAVGDRELAKFREREKKFKNAEISVNRFGKNKSLISAAYRKGDEQVEEALKGIGEELDLHAECI